MYNFVVRIYTTYEVITPINLVPICATQNYVNIIDYVPYEGRLYGEVFPMDLIMVQTLMLQIFVSRQHAVESLLYKL